MAERDSLLVPLLAHPDVPGTGVRRIAARVEPAGPQSLRFRYLLDADPILIRIPPPMAGAGRSDRLWAHTCFEAFIAMPGSPRYLELNFSPSGGWAAYCFDSYRQGMAPTLDVAPRVAVHRSESRLELDAEVQLGGSFAGLDPGPELSDRSRLRLALSTVVEDRDGRLSYWALRHPPGRPDFHHPESFSLALELPRNPLNSP